MTGAGRDSGSATLEFALTAPVLLLLLVAALDFAVGVNAYVTIAGSSREGARYAILHPDAAPSDIAAAVAGRSAPLDVGRITVDARYWDGTDFQPWPAGGVPPTLPEPTGIPVRVEVNYPWSAVSGLTGAFLGGGTGRTLLRASSTMEMQR